MRAWRPEGSAVRERMFALGELRSGALRLVPGQKVGYVTEVVGHAENRVRVVALIRDADLLVIEAVFADEDAALAARKSHLPAQQAGAIARAAPARAVAGRRVSARYSGDAARSTAQRQGAFALRRPAADEPAGTG